VAQRPDVRHLVCARTAAFVRATTALSRPPLAADVRAAYAAPYAAPDRREGVSRFVADIPFAADHPTRPVLDAIAAGVATLQVPALLLWGPRDPVFGEEHLRDLRQRLPHATLHRYETASHLVPEDAATYAADLAAWVSELDRPPRAAEPVGRRPGGRPLWAELEARAHDDAPALVEVGGARVTWAQLHHRVMALAAGLRQAGVRPGDRVGMLVPPSAELTATVYALWRAGAVVVVADRGLGLKGMGRALRGAGLDHVVGSAQGLLAARAMRLPGTRFLAGGKCQPGRYGAGRRSAPPRQLARAGASGMGETGAPLPVPAEDDECAVVFTSGATGPPKGVAYRHRQVQAQVDLIRRAYALTADDALVAAFAPFALYGPALGIGSAVPDIDVTKPGTLTARRLAEAVAAISATVVFASPAALRNVVRPPTSSSRGSARRSAGCGC
jgi:non-ribosomal peptide synthetase component F